MVGHIQGLAEIDQDFQARVLPFDDVTVVRECAGGQQGSN